MLSLDMQVVITCAFRYALGRSTYVVDSVATTIEAMVTELDTNQLRLTEREIEQAIKDKAIGMEIDQQRWLKCRAIILAEIKRRTDEVTHAKA